MLASFRGLRRHTLASFKVKSMYLRAFAFLCLDLAHQGLDDQVDKSIEVSEISHQGAGMRFRARRAASISAGVKRLRPVSSRDGFTIPRRSRLRNVPSQQGTRRAAPEIPISAFVIVALRIRITPIA